MCKGIWSVLICGNIASSKGIATDLQSMGQKFESFWDHHPINPLGFSTKLQET
ncbi:hypothetical protein OA416_02415 [Paracoccaceae bacterium]|nr:hypothetical protein [Paracoccaceae bacterium]